MGLRASALRWMLAATVVLAAAACTGVDDAPAEVAAEITDTTEAAVPSTTTTAALPTTTTAALPTTTTAAPVVTTEAIAPADGDADDADDAENAFDGEPLQEEFRFDCGSHCADEDTGIVGAHLAPGLWQWAPDSAPECVYVAVGPHSWWQIPPGGNPVDELWWLDARGPVVLAEREAVVGYAPAADHLQLVLASNPTKCILERVGGFTSTVDVFAQRHESSDRAAAPDQSVEHDTADWKCYAHAQVGPQPATELNWEVSSSEEHPDVSCVVGEGIAAGWWRWQNPVGQCRYLVIEDADDPNHHRLRRRDASEPVELLAGESVRGYAQSGDDLAPFTINTTLATCVLQHFTPE